jgi:hypothetical protein
MGFRVDQVVARELSSTSCQVQKQSLAADR